MTARHVRVAGLVAAALALAAAGLVLATPGGGDALLVPNWSPWVEGELSCDLDADGADERLVVRDRRLSVLRGDSEAYRSPAGWLVSKALVGDVDDDGSREVVLLVWKRGSYGTSHPFWAAPDDELGQHVLVLAWTEGTLRQRWMSSALHAHVAAAELDDGARLILTTAEGSQTRWQWQQWGFALLDGTS